MNPLSASPVLCFPVTHAQFPSIQLSPLRSKKYCLWMMISRWSILDRDICQDTRFWIQGKSTHTHAQGFNPQVMERVLFPFPLLQHESLILSGTHTHLLFFCFSLSFSHVHFMPAGRKRSYMMPITTPGRASHVSVSTSIPSSFAQHRLCHPAAPAACTRKETWQQSLITATVTKLHMQQSLEGPCLVPVVLHYCERCQATLQWIKIHIPVLEHNYYDIIL